MIVWGVLVGVVIGLFSGNSFGFLLGGLLGAAAGWGLRRAVRAEVAAMLARQGAAPPAAAGPEPAPIPAAPVAVAPPPPERAPAPTPAPTPASAVAAPSAAPPTIAAPEPVSPRPPMETEPDLIERGAGAVRQWLFGGNTIVRAGLVVLFVGLAFLARWAAGAGLLPIEARLALVAAFGVVLLVVGFLRRQARPGFALTLQGGGVAVLYLTIFAAAALYPIIPLTAAFGLMAAVCAGAVALALLQNAQPLAAAAFAGGYAVPLLLGGEGGPVAVMFGYYTLLNLAVLALAWRKAWRSINLIGFLATFGVAAVWTGFAYRPADFAVAETFLALSVAIYLAVAILYARNSAGRFGRLVDTSLLFGVGLVGFGLQARYIADYEYGAAFSALGFAAVYLLLALLVMRRGGRDYRVLADTMLAIGVGFATMAVPLGLGARWTGSVWALEGAGAFWVGMRQARWAPRAFGLVLQAVAALLFLGMLSDTTHAQALINPLFLTGLMVAIPVLATAWWLRRDLAHGGSPAAQAYAATERMLAKPVFLAGFLLWSLALGAEIGRSTPAPEAGQASVAVFAPRLQTLLTMAALVASAWAASLVGRRWNWPVATWPGRVTVVMLAMGWAGLAILGGDHLSNAGWAIWLAAAALHLHLLYLDDRATAGATDVLTRFSHVGGAWLAVLLLGDALRLGVDRAGLWDTSWAGVIFLVAAIVVLALITAWTGLAARRPAESRRWPLDRHLTDYQLHAATPIAALVFFGSLAAAVLAEGAAAPLPYIPLLNPVELSLALGLAALVMWRRAVLAADPPHAAAGWLAGGEAWVALGALGFIELNTAWLRLAHHLLGVVWTPGALFGSTVVQSGITILWTLLALGLMLFAHRRAQRPAWIAGAALLVVVVLKLFFVDLSNASGGARIVTFIVVGVLMLVVGYFAPLPPRPVERKEVSP